MSRERDPGLGDIGGIEVEDARGRPHKPGGGKGPPDGGGRRTPPSGGGQGPWLAVSVGLLALVLVMGAWFYREVSSLRAQVETGLDKSGQRLDNLESLVSATDETLSQSADSIQGQLKTQMHEIRKLWDVSNKRNRDWIEDNQQQIKSLKASNTELNKAVEAVRKELAGVKSSIEQARREQEKTRTQVDLLAETVQQLEKSAASREQRLKELSGLREEWQRMETQLEDINAAIEAFDAYRRQVNERLQALESGGGG